MGRREALCLNDRGEPLRILHIAQHCCIRAIKQMRALKKKGYKIDVLTNKLSYGTDDYEKIPSLNIEIGPTYYLKLIEPKKRPHAHEFDGTWGPYMKHAFDVILNKVSDGDLYDEVYDYGDFKGQKAFVDGQKYTLWLDDKAAGMFKMFWKKHTETGMPDDRDFTFKKGKDKRNRNIWTFKNIKVD